MPFGENNFCGWDQPDPSALIVHRKTGETEEFGEEEFFSGENSRFPFPDLIGWKNTFIFLICVFLVFAVFRPLLTGVCRGK